MGMEQLKNLLARLHWEAGPATIDGLETLVVAVIELAERVEAIELRESSREARESDERYTASMRDI